MMFSIMMFSSQRNWKKLVQFFLESKEFVELNTSFSVKLITSMKNDLSSLSVPTWKTNRLVIEISDVSNCCHFFDARGVFWDYCRTVVSTWTTVSGWFNCNNWYHSGFCFCNNWFAPAILFWCCSFDHSNSACVCSNEETSDQYHWTSEDGFRACSVNIWVGRIIDLLWILLSIFSWIYNCYKDVLSWGYSVLLSVCLF